MIGTDASIVVRVDVMVDALIDALPRTVNDVVPAIGVTADLDASMRVTAMYVLDVIILPASLEELLLFS